MVGIDLDALKKENEELKAKVVQQATTIAELEKMYPCCNKPKLLIPTGPPATTTTTFIPYSNKPCS